MPITLERLEALLIEHEECLRAIDEAIDLARMIGAESDSDDDKEPDSRIYSLLATITNLSRLPRQIAIHERKLMRTNMKRNLWNREKARKHRRLAGIPERRITSTLEEGKRYLEVTHTLNEPLETPEQQAEYAQFLAQQEEPTLPASAQPEVTGISTRAKTKSPEERMRELLGSREEEPVLTPEEMADKLFVDE